MGQRCAEKLGVFGEFGVWTSAAETGSMAQLVFIWLLSESTFRARLMKI